MQVLEIIDNLITELSNQRAKSIKETTKIGEPLKSSCICRALDKKEYLVIIRDSF